MAPSAPKPILLCDICKEQPRHTSRLNIDYHWCEDCIINRGCIFITNPDGTRDILYAPTEALKRYHSSTCPNLLMEGSRNTGKSTAMRWDCHMRALAYAGYSYLVLRKSIPELKKTHLKYIEAEMAAIGGTFHKTDNIAFYPNGSTGYYGHCETEADVLKHLGSQYFLVNFDEITTFPWETVTKIATCARVPKGSDLLALVRAGTNPIGESAEETARYYIQKDITLEEDPDYLPEDWDNIHLTFEDNPHMDQVQYRKRFSGIPEAYRKAWLDGTWGVEGAYFNIMPAHLIQAMPTFTDESGLTQEAQRWPWMHIYRILDWGYNPDPAVCIWVVVLPNGSEVAFKEEYWTITTAKQVAREMVKGSENMRVVTTFSDPTIWSGEKEMGHCLADEFENAGVALTKSKNDRVTNGYASQEHLNTIIDGHPKLRFYEKGVPKLIRAMKAMKVDTKMAGRIDDHKLDHGPICVGYFCMAAVGPTRPPHTAAAHAWMVQKSGNRRILGTGQRRGR